MNPLMIANTLDAKTAFQGLLDSYNQYQSTKQREITNREGIRADRDKELARIKAQKEILELYLKEMFAERRVMLDQTFRALDKGLESGNLAIIEMSLGSILQIAKQSPLAEARQMLADTRNPNVKSIDW